MFKDMFNKDDEVSQKIWWSCIRKRSFSKEQVDKIVDDYASKGVLYYYYKCELCKTYHLTSKPPVKNYNDLQIY